MTIIDREEARDRFRDDERGMSDEAVADEREAFEAIKKAFATFRSEIQDAQAKISTRGNRIECDEILCALTDMTPCFSDIEATLQSERNE